MEQLTLYHNNSSLKTLSDYMDANRITGISVDDLFDFQYNEQKSNRELFFEQMSANEKAAYSKEIGKGENDSLTASDLKSDMTLPCPCIFKIEAKYVTRELAISQTNFQEQTDNVFAFENSLIQRILNNPGYSISKETKRVAPKCSVWGWFKSLYYSGSTLFGSHFQSKNNKFVDISDFIINISTNVSSQGGTFTITLPIIHSQFKEETKSAGTTKMKIPIGGSELNIDLADSYIDRFSEKAELFLYNRYEGDEKKKNFFHKVGLSSMEKNYFNWLIQSNDLIFISFEELQMEQDTGSRVFDMIGLVESVSVSQDANGVGRVTVSGKDLMKLITDDNSLFFNLSSAWGESQIFSNTESVGKQGDIRESDFISGMKRGAENRLRWSTGQLDVFAAPFNRTINFVIKGVISQLANIEVVPDYVFDAWGDYRTKYQDWLSYEEQEATVALSDDEYGDEEMYSNSEFSVGFEFNKPDKDLTIDGGPGMKNEKQFYEGTTPGTGLSLPNPSVYDGLVIK